MFGSCFPSAWQFRSPETRSADPKDTTTLVHVEALLAGAKHQTATARSRWTGTLFLTCHTRCDTRGEYPWLYRLLIMLQTGSLRLSSRCDTVMLESCRSSSF